MKARLPKEYGGGVQNQKDMMRQAQMMQEQFAKTQAELEAKEYAVSSGGGMVEVVINGKKEIQSLIIKPDVVDPEDIEILQDVVMAAVNEAIRTVEDSAAQEMGKITGNLNIPGLF